jgi:hypothetical protein
MTEHQWCSLGVSSARDRLYDCDAVVARKDEARALMKAALEFMKDVRTNLVVISVNSKQAEFIPEQLHRNPSLTRPRQHMRTWEPTLESLS